MANECAYNGRIVAKSRDTIERVLRIMSYDDPEYQLYRVFSVDVDNYEWDSSAKVCRKVDYVKKHGDYYYVDVIGTVAWSCHGWFYDKPFAFHHTAHGSAPFERKYETDKVKMQVSFPFLCEELDFAVEFWGEEEGCELHEHYSCNHKGEVTVYDQAAFARVYDDDGEPSLYDDTYPDKPGLPNFGECMGPEDIFNKIKKGDDDDE